MTFIEEMGSANWHNNVTRGRNSRIVSRRVFLNGLMHYVALCMLLYEPRKCTMVMLNTALTLANFVGCMLSNEPRYAMVTEYCVCALHHHSVPNES